MNSTVSCENNAKNETMRLQVFLAHSGAASRRTAEKYIAQGRVTVNGRTITSMGEKVFPQDEILLDGKSITLETRFHYLALNKPEGYICSSSDTHDRPLAVSLLPVVSERLYNVGRLDYRSCGLILFTNDGDFSAKAGHPSSEIEKEYLVTSTVPIPDHFVDEFRRGVLVEGVLYRAAEAEKTGPKTVRITMIEGKNREIRRVFSHFHLHPEKLMRIRIGPVKLGNLGEGESRRLNEKEIKDILKGGEKTW